MKSIKIDISVCACGCEGDLLLRVKDGIIQFIECTNCGNELDMDDEIQCDNCGWIGWKSDLSESKCPKCEERDFFFHTERDLDCVCWETSTRNCPIHGDNFEK